MGKEDDDGNKKYTGYNDRFSTYVWNSETKQFLGRTGVAWAKLTIFYIIFYIGLACFATLCYYLFSLTLNEERPKWMLDKSLIGTNPGLGYRPMPDPNMNADSTLIWYNVDSISEASFWFKQLEKYVDEIEHPEFYSDANALSLCGYNNPNKASENTSCKVETMNDGCNKKNNFGYTTGEPSILLKLNKILGWEPDAYGIKEDGSYDLKMLEQELKEQTEVGMPKSMAKNIMRTVKAITSDTERAKYLKTVWVSCGGESKSDEEALGDVAYFPQPGIPGYYFPYFKQDGYKSPFMFAQFKNPIRGTLINIECKAWARNIIHDRINRIGSVHFELLIDGKAASSRG